MADTEQIDLNDKPAETEKMDLSVKIDKPSTCQRHVIVTVSRADVDRYFRKAYDDLTPKAELPGFRPGKAPRKLVESRFKEQMKEQVKSSVLMDSLAQVTEGGEFSPISEPDLDYQVIEIPDEGDFTYEFKIEVRPEFDTPNWKGLELEMPSYDLTEKDIDQQLGRTLSRFALGEAVDAAAEEGDTLVVNIEFRRNGNVLTYLEGEKIVLRQKLSFADATYDKFVELMAGAKEGESRTATITIDERASNEALRGAEIEMEVQLVEVRRMSVDALDANTLEMLGFDDPQELRNFVRDELTKQQKYYQHQSLRKQVTEKLTQGADWDLPEDLVSRQTNRELQRQALELRRSGFGENDLASYMNASRKNAKEMTIKALREHFLLEKLAEDAKIEADADEYDTEINLIAEQSEMSPRRIRARLEKTGQMDAIRNQIVERKVVDLIVSEAKVTKKEDKSFLTKQPQETAIDFLVAPVAQELPEAKYDEKPEDVQKPGSAVKLNP